MQTLVAYDVTNDKLRCKIADECMNAGLVRTQFSVFLGELDEKQRILLVTRIREHFDRYLDEEDDNPDENLLVQIFPICASDFAKSIEMTRSENLAVDPVNFPDVLVV